MTQGQQNEFNEASKSFKELRAMGVLCGQELDSLETIRERAIHDHDWSDLFVSKIRKLTQEAETNAR